MADIDKLTQTASSELKSGEDFKQKAAGKTVFDGEIVDGFFGATDHKIVVLVKSLFGVKRLECFAYSQISEYLFNKDENSFYLVGANEHFILRDVLPYPDPNELFKFIKGKKSPPEKTTFEAVSLTVQPAKK